MKKNRLDLSLIIISSLVVAAALVLFVYSSNYFGSKKTVQAVTGLKPLSGYAWSASSSTLPNGTSDVGGVGWIGFAGTGYQVTLDPTTGNLSGYAWADPHDDLSGTDNIGWISFNGPGSLGGDIVDTTANCPATLDNPNCQPNVNLITGKVTGWAKVLSMFNEQNSIASPPGPDINSEGWISLSGTNYPSPNFNGTGGVTYSSSTGSFIGFAWEPAVFGWINFSSSTPNGGGGTCGPNCGVTIPVSPCVIGNFNYSWGSCVNNLQSQVWDKKFWRFMYRNLFPTSSDSTL